MWLNIFIFESRSQCSLRNQFTLHNGVLHSHILRYIYLVNISWLVILLAFYTSSEASCFQQQNMITAKQQMFRNFVAVVVIIFFFFRRNKDPCILLFSAGSFNERILSAISPQLQISRVFCSNFDTNCHVSSSDRKRIAGSQKQQIWNGTRIG